MAVNFAEELGIEGLMAGASQLSRPAEEYVNNGMIEELWAIKAFEHAEIYFNLISSIDPKLLRLTKLDDTIYQEFRSLFPDFGVALVTQDELKTPEAKELWRNFCENYKETVEDYNYATLLRLDCNLDYSEANSIIVPRVQFLALELARNREGNNDSVRKNFKPKKLHAKQ